MLRKGVKLSHELCGEGETVLHCPNCDGFYLHQRKTEVFERSEDAKEGLHVTVENEQVMTDKNLTGNPSGRRHGLKVHFRCETCSANVQMVIYQHKGNTFAGMLYDAE